MAVGAIIFATLDRGMSDLSVTILAADLTEALGSSRLLNNEGLGCVFKVPKSQYLELPSMLLPQTECVLQVSPETPYYGKGYERGRWHEIAAILEFLRYRLPGSRVWYGADGTEMVDEVTQDFLDSVWSYWSEHGGRPYYEKRPAK